MTNLRWGMLWAFLYGVCAALGFIPNPAGALEGLMIVLSVGFFIPPAVLAYRAIRGRDFILLLKIRYISLIWMGLTTLAIILNMLTAQASQATGLVLYWLLILVSAPMVCSGVWLVPIFLWACLLTVTVQFREKKKRK